LAKKNEKINEIIIIKNGNYSGTSQMMRSGNNLQLRRTAISYIDGNHFFHNTKVNKNMTNDFFLLFFGT